MSIQQVSAYRVGEQVFPTIEEAQIKELTMLLSEGGVMNEIAESVVERILEHTDEVVDILTSTPKAAAKRKPRSDIGKKREPKDVTATHT